MSDMLGRLAGYAIEDDYVSYLDVLLSKGRESKMDVQEQY